MKSNRGFTAIQTVRGCFSAVERRGYRQWASNAEPTYITGTQMMIRIDSRAGIEDYSLAKKNYPVLSELQSGFTLIEILISTAILLIAVAGFLAWTANVVHQRAGLAKRNVAYNIAVDVSDRLAKLSGTNVFLLPNSG